MKHAGTLILLSACGLVCHCGEDSTDDGQQDAFRLHIEIPRLDQTLRFMGRYKDVIKGRCRGKDQNHTKPTLLTKVQANLVILPGKHAEQFRDFCSLALDLSKNSKVIDVCTDGFVVRTSKACVETVMVHATSLHTQRGDMLYGNLAALRSAQVTECACRGAVDVLRLRPF